MDSGPRPRARRPRAWGRAFSRLALLAFGLLVGLALTETAVRVLGVGRPGLYIYDADRGWALQPGAHAWQNKEGHAYVSVSSAGLRDREHQYRKPGNTLRIAFLGDSFTEAKQVSAEQTFCAIVQRRLNALHAFAGKSIETLNFGVDSYGTAQELMTLRHQVWKFSPDVVVLDVFTGNDIRNDSIDLEGDKCQPFFSYRDGELVLSGPFQESAWFRLQCRARFESQRSALLNVLGQLRSALRARRRRRRAIANARPTQGIELGLDDWIYRPPDDPQRREAWKVAEGEIEMIHQEVAAHGALFLVVTLSNGVQVYPDPALRLAYMRHSGLATLFYPDQRIKALGERMDFPVLNLAPPLQAYADQHHVFLHGFRDTQLGFGHWNPEGHLRAGELIADRLYTLMGPATVRTISAAP
jgi:hypothetical protein